MTAHAHAKEILGVVILSGTTISLSMINAVLGTVLLVLNIIYMWRKLRSSRTGTKSFRTGTNEEKEL